MMKVKGDDHENDREHSRSRDPASLAWLPCRFIGHERSMEQKPL